MAFSVIIHEKGGQPRRQDFDKNEITIGRVQGNDIVLPKQNVSKRHSRLVYKNQKFVITDLRSTNGTYVNGRKISAPNVIKENDKIYIGDFVLSTEASGAGASNAIPVSSTPPPPPPNFNAPFGGGMPAQTIASGMSPFVQKKEAASPETGLSTPPVSNSMIPPAPPTPTPIPPAPPAPPTPPAPPATLGRPTPPPSLPKAPSGLGSTPSPFSQKSEASTVAKAVESTPVIDHPQGPITPSAPPSAPKADIQSAPVAIASTPVVSPNMETAVAYIKKEVPSPVVSAHSSEGMNQFRSNMIHALNEKGYTLPGSFTLKQSLTTDIKAVVKSVKSNLGSSLNMGDHDYVVNELFHLGSLTQLVHDQSISSILLQGTHLVYRDQKGSRQTKENPFSSPLIAQQIARRILSSIGGQEGDYSGSGQLGKWRVVVDLEGAGSPYLSFDRALNTQSLDAWIEQGTFDLEVLKAVEESVAEGQGIIIASNHPKLQAQMSSAFLYQFFDDQTVASVGVPFNLGSEGSWMNFEGSPEDLNRALRFAPQCLIVGDQPALLVEDRVDAICASSNGILCLTMPTAQSAYEWLTLKLADAQVIPYGFRLILNVDVDDQGNPYLTSAFDLHQQKMMYTR
jgi:hypothetical protein